MYLNKWICKKINIPEDIVPSRRLLEDYQLRKLRETISYAVEHSPYYYSTLGKYCRGEILHSLKSLEELPFTTVKDLKDRPLEMLCVRLGEISRVVTLHTNGPTAVPKRIYFTDKDQELTVDYFHNCIQSMVDQSDKVLILLSHERPGSVGDLLRTGLERLGADVTFDANDKGITSIVGMPTEIFRMASGKNQLTPRTVLLTGEYVNPTNISTLKAAWSCRVFEHYGMTEMGMGGAMSCRDTTDDPPVGYHARETDLYVEIINPKTGKVVPDGQYGEVVFTTLTRNGMPLIRHRTGDIGRWLAKPCSCGSIFKRLDRIGPPQPERFERLPI